MAAFALCRHRCSSFSMTSVALQLHPSSSNATFSVSWKHSACFCRVRGPDSSLVNLARSPCAEQYTGQHLLGVAWQLVH